MIHRGPFQPLPFCDSVTVELILYLLSPGLIPEPHLELFNSLAGCNLKYDGEGEAGGEVRFGLYLLKRK